MNTIAAPLAVAAAASYGLAAALQHRSARRERPYRTLDPRLLFRLAQRPLWLAGAAADLAGATLHAVALALGPLALVQPILISGLAMAILLEAALDRRWPHRRDLVAVGLSAAGLATFITLTQPRPGAPASGGLAGATVVVSVVVALLVGLATRLDGARRATLLGIATGALYALAAALAKACLSRVGNDPIGLLTDARLYGFILAGLLGLLLNQNAFQAGPLAGPLTGITLTDPLVSLAIAVAALNEELTTGGVRSLVELVAVLAMATATGE